MKVWVLAPNGVMTPVAVPIAQLTFLSISESEIEDAIYAINYMIVRRVYIVKPGESFEATVSYRAAMKAFEVRLAPYKVCPQEYYTLIGRATPLSFNRESFSEAIQYYRMAGWDTVIDDGGDYNDPAIILSHFKWVDYEALSKKFFLHY